MALIKSYGNYVLQQKHKLINQGTIFERDYSTIGGIGEGFDSNPTTYRQGTFVYEINDEIVTTKIYNNNEWVKNDKGEFWNQENIANSTSSSNSLEIVLKQDIHKLKDFAYYGSCVELVRSSIIDIVNKFPGELYVLQDTVLVDKYGEIIQKDRQELLIVDNPFNIDIHTPSSFLDIDEQNELKYILANYDKYIFINKEGEEYEIENCFFNFFTNANCVLDFFGEIIINVKLNSSTESYKLYAYRDENRNILYTSPINQGQFRIRPKQEHYDEFIKNLDAFQKTLLNVNSKPIYSAIFEVMEENEYGYRTFYKKFIFPLGEGEYNLNVNGDEYIDYINALSNYAALYDEVYCNNLYRNMTHESIKNFDWSDVLQRGEETKEDYIENGQKVEKLLLLCGRELDEIKYYIDGIKNSNVITYNDANNIPDYFLTDTLNIEGWDVKNIFPFQYNNGIWSENLTLEVKPYGNVIYGGCDSIINFPNGYFSGYWGENCDLTRNDNTEKTKDTYTTDNKGILRERIMQYINEKTYSMDELNNKFMKYLKMNSRNIFQRKGTVDALESVLGLFGLRSKRWYDALEHNAQNRLIDDLNVTYDYEITEHVAIAKPLEEINTVRYIIEDFETLPHHTHLLSFLNSTKDLVYNTKIMDSMENSPYQGLPIRYYDVSEEKRVLYPYFSYNIPIDGKPYYQMNGGWIHKNFKWDNEAQAYPNINNGGFIDTNTQVPMVNNVKELLKIESEKLYNGIIYYVKNIKGYYICVNDEIYDIKQDSVVMNRYFEVPIYNGSITIGKQKWYGSIETYSNKINDLSSDGIASYEEAKEIITIDLTKYKNGSLLKIFIQNDNTILVKQEEQVLINYAIFRDGLMENISSIFDEEETETQEPTNYFVLGNVEWKGMLGFWGWNQLDANDYRYKTIKKIKRNYLGNNPHTNGFKYDNGIEYINYFDKLFKYAIENERFKPQCYSTTVEYVTSLNYIENEVGFANLIEENECERNIKLYNDKKIHHFCDYFNTNGSKNYFYELNDNEESIDSKRYYNLYENQDYEYLNNDNNLKDVVDKNETCLDQIINLKNVTLTIYPYRSINDNAREYGKNIKYFEEIILHYLSQVLPSNVILNVVIGEK